MTRRSILMLKEDKPEWGCQRISDVLARGPGLGASAGAVARVLHEAGYELEEMPTYAHADRVRQFERAKPNELWQTFSVHAEGERVILTRQEGERHEIDLVPPAGKRTVAAPDPLCPQAAPAGEEGNEEPPAPGVSPLDAMIGGCHE